MKNGPSEVFCLRLLPRLREKIRRLPNTSLFSHDLCSSGEEAKAISVEYVQKPVVKYGHYIIPLHISWINHLC